MPSRRLVLAAAVAMATLAFACNALIGIADVPPAGADSGSGADADAGVPGSEGSADEMAPPAEGGRAMDSGDSGMSAAHDAASDTTNEGAAAEGGFPCGHDCLGGACLQGRCQPFALVSSDAGLPAKLAQDGNYLYWTDTMNWVVNRTLKTTGATLPMTTATTQPFPIVYDDAGAGVVYWGDLTGVHYCPASGCVGTPPTVAATSQRVSALAVDSTSVYWTSAGPEIWVASKFGSNETGAALWDGDASTVEIAADGRQVFFTADDGQLHAVNADGGGGTAASWGAPMSASSWGIALFGNAVYWTLADPSVGQVYGASVTTPSITVSNLASGQLAPRSLATDGTMIYWANVPAPETGSVLGCEIANCQPTTSILAQDNSYNPAALLVDDVAVYWSDNGNNATIWKLAK